MRTRLAYLIPYAMLALALAFRLYDPWPVKQLRLLVFDSFQRIAPRIFDPRKSPARIVAIDEASLKRIGQWPWPRTLVAKLVDRLSGAGASAIVFDIIFAEPDGSSPENAVKRWPAGPALEKIRKAAGALPSHDRLFAAALARAPTVTAFVLERAANQARPRRIAGLAFAGADPRAVLPAFAGAVLTLPILEKAAKGNGSISFTPDRDLIIRRVPLFSRLGKHIYPGLSVEALRVAQRTRGYLIKSVGASGEIGAGAGIVAIRIGRLAAPTDGRGRFVMHYRPAAPQLYIPAWRVLAGKIERREIAGRIVFIGATAAGLRDLRATTLEVGVPGVEIHAQLIEQIVTGTFLRRPDFITGIELLFVLIAGLSVLVLLPRIGAVWSGSLGVFAIAGASLVSWFAYANAGWLVDPIYPSIAVILTLLTGTMVVYLRSEAERRQVRNAFSRYMSPELVEQLAGNPGRLVLGGENREMSLLFCDIRGFTGISEGFADAHELTAFINRFLTPMTHVILQHRGTIDKYMGDCIMAFWNAPLSDPDHAVHACRSALEMVDALATLNAEWADEAKRAKKEFAPVRVGIGLNTGIACVGNLGSEQRFDYSVIGDEVNLASRLEGQSKTYGFDIIIGEKTKKAAPGFAMIEIDLIRVIGRTQPARIYALLGDEAHAASDGFEQLADTNAKFLAAYRRRDWRGALGLLKSCRTLGGSQLAGLYDMFAGRIAGFANTPPPKDWTGIYEAERK
ncbi:MAG: adenylate/guanylate cyclase domain-containing protein [Alphaproteobacteria bacterium]|nr:adenylate/guanylate cyclase domain-containing protein [Alphaproteobacteria bacterium]